MVAAIATRVPLYPGIESEVCPPWAQGLIGINPPQTALGVPFERVSLKTRQAQADLFPTPGTPQRKRTRHMTVKTYVKSWPVSFFDSCLPFALGKQHDLFSETNAPEDIAVLCFSKLCDFAKCLGMSYDQVEQWMTLLIVLGFIRRFRHGRRFLYVIPLSDYIPQPSPAAVRDKLNSLIFKQFTEEVDATAMSMYRDRNPEFTAYLFQIRERFEKRYGLFPTGPQLIPLTAEKDLADLLREIHQVLPSLSREELENLTPILMKRLIDGEQQTSALGTRRRYGRCWRLVKTIESSLSAETFPIESAREEILLKRSRTHNLAGEANEGKIGSLTESACSSQNREANSTAGTNRFDFSPQPAQFGRTSLLRKETAPNREEICHQENVDSVVVNPLTLRSLSKDISNKDNYVNVSENLLEEKRKQEKTEQYQELGEMLSRLFLDEKSKDYFISIHRRGNPQLILAAVIKTMYTGLNSGYTKSAGACFTNVYKRWTRLYKSYQAACDEGKAWGSTNSAGIPRAIRDLVALHQSDTYEQIADSMGFKLDPVTSQPFSQDSQQVENALPITQYLSQIDAQVLASEIRRHASWYFPTICIVPKMAYGTDLYAVEAEGDLRYLFTSREEWQTLHEQMLSLPRECEDWYRRACKGRLNSAEDEFVSVQAALAFLVYCNDGLHRDAQGVDWSQLQWDELVTLGRPILFPYEGVFDQQDQANESHATPVLDEAVKEEVREALAAGMLVQLDVDTIVSFDEYESCYWHAQRVLAEEEWQWTVEGLIRSMAGSEEFQGAQPNASIAVSNECAIISQDEGVSKETVTVEDLLDEQVMNLREASTGYQQLLHALDPSSYCIAVRPKKIAQKSGFVLSVTSRLSSNAWIFDTPEQIEEILQELKESAEG